MVRVAISGYFDPLHVGHLEYMRLSKQLGDKLIVIVNNDKQAILKKGKPFMPEDIRVEIVKAIKWVDEVFLSIDEDSSVCKSLAVVKPDIFTNGGDRHNYEIPEAKVCRELGIELREGMGEKIQSSSYFVKRSENGEKKD